MPRMRDLDMTRPEQSGHVNGADAEHGVGRVALTSSGVRPTTASGGVATNGSQPSYEDITTTVARKLRAATHRAPLRRHRPSTRRLNDVAQSVATAIQAVSDEDVRAKKRQARVEKAAGFTGVWLLSVAVVAAWQVSWVWVLCVAAVQFVAWPRLWFIWVVMGLYIVGLVILKALSLLVTVVHCLGRFVVYACRRAVGSLVAVFARRNGQMTSPARRQAPDSTTQPRVTQPVERVTSERRAVKRTMTEKPTGDGLPDWFVYLWILWLVMGVLAAIALVVLGVEYHADVSTPVAVMILVAGAIVLAGSRELMESLLAPPVLGVLPAVARGRRRAPDPTQPLVELLFKWAVNELPTDDNVADVRNMERVARALESDLASARVPRGAGSVAWITAGEHGRRRAAWVRRRTDDLLMQTPGMPAAMTQALLAVCAGHWEAVETEPTQTRGKSFIRRALPRVAVAAALVVAAILVPDVLPVKAAAKDSFTVALILLALNALLAPTDAIKEAVKRLSETNR